MAEKKSALGAIIAVGAVAAAGVAAYFKRAEIKKVTEDILAKLKTENPEGVFTADRDEDGQVDVIMADTDGDDNIDTILMDNDGDGVIDEAAVDNDGDGIMDVVSPVECEESDFAE